MSRHGFTDFTTANNGGDLVGILEAIQSGHLGAVGDGPPAYVEAGMTWVKQVDADTMELYLHVGGDPAVDLLMGTADLAAGEYLPANQPSPGGLQFLGTADASGDATIEFTAFDATKYDSYLFVLGNVIPEDGGTDSQADFYVRFSSDGGSTWITASGEYDDTTDAGETSYLTLAEVNDDDKSSSTGVSGTLEVPFPSIASEYTHVYFAGSESAAGNATLHTTAGIVKDKAAHDAIQFAMAGTVIASGTITMYGRRNGSPESPSIAARIT